MPVDVDLAHGSGSGLSTRWPTGRQPIEVPPADDCPDGVFVEDTMVVFRDLAVIARSGADERRAEAAEAERTVAARATGSRTSPSPAPSTAATSSRSARPSTSDSAERTNAAGADQLRGFLGTARRTVVARYRSRRCCT